MKRQTALYMILVKVGVIYTDFKHITNIYRISNELSFITKFIT